VGGEAKPAGEGDERALTFPPEIPEVGVVSRAHESDAIGGTFIGAFAVVGKAEGMA
jgi:hypothetical protein